MTTFFIILAILITAFVTWYVTTKIENAKSQNIFNEYTDLINENSTLKDENNKLNDEIVSLKAKVLSPKFQKIEAPKKPKAKKTKTTKK